MAITVPSPVCSCRNIDVGNKTEALAEAAMRGELDEAEETFGNEGGAFGAAKGAGESSDDDKAAAQQQFATAN